MRFKIYVFMYMCLYFFVDSKKRENEREISIFFSPTCIHASFF